jgi:hypothetical protein
MSSTTEHELHPRHDRHPGEWVKLVSRKQQDHEPLKKNIGSYQKTADSLIHRINLPSTHYAMFSAYK